MHLAFSEEDEAFRADVRAWLEQRLQGEWVHVRGRGGPGDEHALVDERLAWERHLGEHGYIGVGWPAEAGGRGLSILQQVIWHEEYARAGGPGRLGHIGETLAAPTVIAFGTDEQRATFLPPIQRGEVIWCQGYSEPNAGSDLANVQTRAVRDGDEWVITGQKVWTSHAHLAQWCFVIARTEPGERHRGLSYIMVPMDQPGVDVRPIQQITGSSEFNEVFFDGARARVADTIGGAGNGWKVAMGTLAFERGASTLGQQLSFRNEFDAIVAAAKANGAVHDPVIRQRLADAHIGLRIMRFNALRMLAGGHDGTLPPEAMISKLYWATWHRDLGKLAMDVLGPDAELCDGTAEQPELRALQRMFLFARADTIYAGSTPIQRNIIAVRALGLPR